MPQTLSIAGVLCRIICFFIIVLHNQPVNAQSWQELNPPPNPFNRQIHALLGTSGGQVYAAGDFENQDGKKIVAVLNGDLWTELGTGSKSLKANNSIYALAMGSGKLYAAGIFSNSQGYPYVAQWDGNSWTELQSNTPFNFNNSIYSLTVDNAGNLYAAGAFSDAMGFSFVAKWNGSNWVELGTGSNALSANGIIYAVTTDVAGNVYAAGHFTNSSGKYYVAKWNGNTWTEPGTASNAIAADEYIQTLATDGAGNLYAGGSFKNGSGSRYVAKWNGTSWAEVGTGANALNGDGVITSISVQQNGNMYAAGHLTDGSGNRTVYYWNGITWQKAFVVPSNQASSVINAMSAEGSGNMFLGGAFTNGSNRQYVAKWDGHLVTEPGRNGRNLQMWNGIDHVAVSANGDVYALGRVFPSGNNVAHWNGKSWSALGGDTAILPVDPTTSGVATDHAGNLYVGGNFKNAHNNYYIAKWDGQRWSELGASFSPVEAVEPVTVMTSDLKGNVYAAGAFFTSGSSFSYGIIKWDGSNTTFYHSPDNPASICVDSAGNIYAGSGNPDENGKYQVAKITSQGWTILGSGGASLNSGSMIKALAIDGKGNILASGLNNQGWNTHHKFVAKWDGTTWSEADNDPSGKYSEGAVYDMTSDKYGNVYAAARSGAGITYYTVAKWDGVQWTDIGLNVNTNVTTIVSDVQGNVYAAGLFSNEGNFQFVAKYEINPAVITPETPVLGGMSTSYCQQSGVQTITITNMPDTVSVAVQIKLDNNAINIPPDGKLKFDTRQLQAGSHTIAVIYTAGNISKTASATFEIITARVPAVSLSANLDATGNLMITATPIAGGAAPLFTFFMVSPDNPLQAESLNNILQVKPVDITQNGDWVYVRMRTSETCAGSATAIDSIRISPAFSNGLSDPDFPEVNIGSYPNPFTNNINLAGLSETKKYTIMLVNSSGGRVLEKNVSNVRQVSLQLPVLTGNIYWLHIYDNTKSRRIGTIMVMKRG